ncbi:MAG TPA: YciI family protein [Candidatus Eisenbacteria bacterium]|nr:YciI family protein [Candidatus Eisenbacteria bacterium]
MRTWVYQLHWRPTLWEDMTKREESVLDEHDRYIESLYTQGLVVLAGAIEDPPTGLVFIQATDENKAKAIMASDPCVLSKIVDVTLHAFSAGYVGAGAGYNHLGDAVESAGESN